MERAEAGPSNTAAQAGQESLLPGGIMSQNFNPRYTSMMAASSGRCSRRSRSIGSAIWTHSAGPNTAAVHAGVIRPDRIWRVTRNLLRFHSMNQAVLPGVCPVSVHLAVFAINRALDGLAANSQCSWHLQALAPSCRVVDLRGVPPGRRRTAGGCRLPVGQFRRWEFYMPARWACRMRNTTSRWSTAVVRCSCRGRP
jgi:hypothetical protein